LRIMFHFSERELVVMGAGERPAPSLPKLTLAVFI
jgi:hypothetical protein